MGTVTDVADGKTVTVHGADEQAKVNSGVITFGDTTYSIGLDTNPEGVVSVVYDSWVMGGGMRERIDGRGEHNGVANLKTCTSLAKAARASQAAKRKIVVSFAEGRARAFVHA